jgi:glycosyltransferase involved in cell wall biosynthesis
MSKIMLHGNAPWVPSAYGQQLGLLAKQLRSLGHEVAFSANWGLQGAGLNWSGFQVFPAADGNSKHGCSLLPGHAAAWKADLVIALGDAWYWPADVMAEIGCRLALWMPIDCKPLGGMDDKAIRAMPAAKIIAMSEHGLTELGVAGHKATYIPHAYDPAVYHPTAAEDRAQHRAKFAGVAPDTFVIGLCAANKDGCRKGFGEQFRAFANFHARHENSRLLVHAVPGKEQGGIDLRNLAGLLGISDAVSFPGQYALDCGLYSTVAMASWFKSLDLLSSCSWGEGFGVPVLEAQACGTPAVVTDFAAQAVLPARWRVEADPWLISAHDAWWGRPNVASIEAAYEDAFHQWQHGATQLREEAAMSVLSYAAAAVTETHWQPWLESEGLAQHG